MAWTYTATIISRLNYPSYVKGKMKRIDIMQCQFNKKLLEAYMAFKRMWEFGVCGLRAMKRSLRARTTQIKAYDHGRYCDLR